MDNKFDVDKELQKVTGTGKPLFPELKKPSVLKAAKPKPKRIRKPKPKKTVRVDPARTVKSKPPSHKRKSKPVRGDVYAVASGSGPKAPRRNVPMMFRVTQAECAGVLKAAKAEGFRSMSAWVRSKCGLVV